MNVIYKYHKNYKLSTNINSVECREIRIQNFTILLFIFSLVQDFELTEISFPISFSTPPFVSVYDNNGNVSFAKSVAVGWSTYDSVKFRNILGSGTACVIGLI